MKVARLALVLLVVAGCASVAGPASTPSPTPWPNAQQPGVIYFGRSIDRNTLMVTEPATLYGLSELTYWSCYFTEPPNALSVTWLLAYVDAAGNESVAKTSMKALASPDTTLVSDSGILSSYGPKGTYVMRYFAGTRLLAEGTFQIV